MAFAGLTLRFALATVFIAAGASKLPRRDEFTDAVRNFGLLAPRIVRPIALLIPPLELGSGLLLATGLAVIPVSLFLAGLLTAFTGAIGVNLLRGRALDCACFSTTVSRQITWLTVTRNVALIAAALLVALAAPTVLAVDAYLVSRQENSVSTGDAIAALIVGTVAIIGLAVVGQLARLRAVIRRGKDVA